MSISTRVAAAALLAVASAAMAQGSAEPYSVTVWSRVLFGPDGKVAEAALVDEAKLPAAFAENALARVKRASIQPQQVDGKPVTFRSGVELRFRITPQAQGGGTVRVEGVHVGPLPVKRYYASYPKDVGRTAGWEGEAAATCSVAVDGRCASIEVNALPGMPESVRRFMRASLEGWEFEPQQVDGQPVEGQHRLAIRFRTLDDLPIEDFREDKLDRLMRGR
jgi:hypothetical protein